MRILAAAILSMLLSFPAFADAHPCQADADRLCKGVQPGQGRIMACMKQHQADISAECKERMRDFHEEMMEASKECRPDAEKFCKGVKPGQGRIVRCLQQHKSELSDQCKEAGARLREDRGDRGDHEDGRGAAVCRDDAAKLCKDVKSGGGRIAQCLRDHRADVSAACGAQLDKHKGRGGHGAPDQDKDDDEHKGEDKKEGGGK